MNITTATEKGARDYQEDRIIYNQFHDGTLAAVFDGHGGDETAQTAADRLIGLWSNISEKPMNRMGRVFRLLYQLTKNNKNGSTASIVWIPKGNHSAFVGVMGDSPVVIKDSSGTIKVSPEHNIRTNEKEFQAAQRRGGIIANGYLFYNRYGDGLQMSRALGDSELAPVLNYLPEIYKVELSSTSWVLLASDGVFDPGHNNTEQMIHQIAKKIDNGAGAQQLVDDAVNLPTGDNASAILIKI